MAEKPYWWTVLMFIPLVGLITGIILWVRIAENAGHHGGWGVAMFVPFVNLIALLYLAFSSGGPKRTSPPLVSGDRPRTPQSVG